MVPIQSGRFFFQTRSHIQCTLTIQNDKFLSLAFYFRKDTQRYCVAQRVQHSGEQLHGGNGVQGKGSTVPQASRGEFRVSLTADTVAWSLFCKTLRGVGAGLEVGVIQMYM